MSVTPTYGGAPSVTPSISSTPTSTWQWDPAAAGGLELPQSDTLLTPLSNFIVSAISLIDPTTVTDPAALGSNIAQSVVFAQLLAAAPVGGGAAELAVAADARAAVLRSLSLSLVASANTTDSSSPPFTITSASAATAAGALALLSTGTLTGDASSSIIEAAVALTALAPISPMSATSIGSSIGAALLASAVAAPPQVPTVGLKAGAALPAPLPIPMGGLSTAMADNAAAAVSSLTRSLLSSAVAGATVAVLPPVGAGNMGTLPVSSYCGAAPAAAAMLLSNAASATSQTLETKTALLPCGPISGAKQQAIAVAQAPPAVAIDAKAVAALSAAMGGGPVLMTMTQWGVSPFPESAGGASRVYPALSAASDVAATSLATAAAGIVTNKRNLGGLVGGFVRMLETASEASIAALLKASGGQSASQVATAALLSRFPRTALVNDLLPGRPLDSRVIQLTISSAVLGTTVDMSTRTLSPPLRVVVPLRDLSILGNNTNGTGIVNIGTGLFEQRAFNITCPKSPRELFAEAVYTMGGVGPVVVRVEIAIPGSFTSVVGAEQVTAPISSGASSMADAGAATNTAFIVGSVKTVNGTMLTAAAPVVASSGYAYVLSVDCGIAFGTRGFVCGDSGARISFSCPSVRAVPTCLMWNRQLNSWASDICSVMSTAESSVTCSCPKAGSIAVRYAALESIESDVFAPSNPVTTIRVVDVYYAALGLLVGFLALHGVGALVSGGKRGTSEKENVDFTAALDADGEMVEARVGVEMRGRPWRYQYSRGAAAGAKVAPPSTTPTLENIITTKASTDPLLSAFVERVTASLRGTSVGAPPSRVLVSLQEWRLSQAKAVTSENVNKIPPMGTLIRIALLRAWVNPPAACLSCARRVRAPPDIPSSAPRYQRFLVAITSGFVGLAITAMAYANGFQGATSAAGKARATPELPTLSSSSLFQLALIATIAVNLVDAILLVALQAVAHAEALIAAPGLAEHQARVSAAAETTSCLSTRTLLELGAPAAASVISSDDLNLLAADGEDSSPVMSDLVIATAAALARWIEVAVAVTGSGSKKLGPHVARIILSFALACTACVALSYTMIFVLSRGPAAGAGVIGAWSSGAAISFFLVQPVYHILTVRIAFAFTPPESVNSKRALLAWHAVVTRSAAAVAAAGAGAGAGAGNNLDFTSAVVALAPLTLLALAWKASATNRLRWAALSATVAVVLIHVDALHEATKDAAIRLGIDPEVSGGIGRDAMRDRSDGRYIDIEGHTIKINAHNPEERTIQRGGRHLSPPPKNRRDDDDFEHATTRAEEVWAGRAVYRGKGDDNGDSDYSRAMRPILDVAKRGGEKFVVASSSPSLSPQTSNAYRGGVRGGFTPLQLAPARLLSPSLGGASVAPLTYASGSDGSLRRGFPQQPSTIVAGVGVFVGVQARPALPRIGASAVNLLNGGAFALRGKAAVHRGLNIINGGGSGGDGSGEGRR